MTDTTLSDEALLQLENQATLLSGPLVPLLPPKPASRPLPPLPLRSSSTSPFGPAHAGWKCETFIVPAAFPRSTTGSTRLPTASPETPEPGTRVKIDPKKAFKELLEPQIAALGRQVDVEDKNEIEEQVQLFVAVNRYSRSVRRVGRGLTLVFAHANGFHKEIWEPTMADLLDQLDDAQQPQSLPVDEIWALDAINQGDSGVLNEHVLGTTFNWADNGRDILNFIISYLDSPSSTFTTPFLPSLPLSDSSLLALDNRTPSVGSSSPTERTFRDRLIVGIGHSLGGGGMVYASTAVPSLFSSVILCDPVLPTPWRDQSVRSLTTGALVRREKWETKEEVKEGFLKKAFFQQWDPRVLDSYCTMGIKEVKGGGVALKARAKDEALVFCDPKAVAARRACSRLATLPSSLPVHFVFADVGRSVLSEDEILKMLRFVPHATTARVEGAGHLIAQEKPAGTASEIVKFLRRVYPAKKSAKL